MIWKISFPSDWELTRWALAPKSKVKKKKESGELLAEVRPEDLLKFGLIPEFIGRLPVIATLNELDESTLIRILLEPKDAIIKQYKKLFELENVNLKFTDGALRAVAKLSMERKSGARGLRSILENTMLEIMYDIPSRNDIKECVISEEVVIKKEKPILIYEENLKLLKKYTGKICLKKK